MDIAHLFSKAKPIPSHAIAAILAITIGGWQLFSKKGNRVHRYVGYLWVSLMLYVSISSFWIHSLQVLGIFSPIHLLSIFTIWALFESIRAARSNNLVRHKRMMKLLYILGLIITGLFTLLPNRIMFQVLLA